MEFFHNVAGLVHRDIEDKNFGFLEDGSPCVSDLSTCVPLTTEDTKASGGYAGEFLCELMPAKYSQEVGGCFRR
jgi:hypothetical protein